MEKLASRVSELNVVVRRPTHAPLECNAEAQGGNNGVSTTPGDINKPTTITKQEQVGPPFKQQGSHVSGCDKINESQLQNNNPNFPSLEPHKSTTDQINSESPQTTPSSQTKSRQDDQDDDHHHHHEQDIDASKREQQATRSDTPSPSAATTSVQMTAACVNNLLKRPQTPPAKQADMHSVICSAQGELDAKLQSRAPSSIVTSPILAEASSTRRPQRKLSVFSFNGFPSSVLLDAQAVTKCLPSASIEASCQAPASASQSVASQSSASSSLANSNSSSNNQHQVHASQVSSNRPSVASSATKVRRSTRSDTLSSTGSSRASSCDEPTILSGARNSALAAPAATAGTPLQGQTDQSSAGNKHPAAAIQLMQGSSSSSSLDSLVGGGSGSWQSTQSSSDNQQQASLHCLTLQTSAAATTTTNSKSFSFTTSSSEPSSTASNTASSNSIIVASKPPLPPASSAEQQALMKGAPIAPFESIKAQLKRNSIPNAQVITRHIDNLISQNEAIVDNCNLVSIRSYNSSRLSNPSSLSQIPASQEDEEQQEQQQQHQVRICAAGTRINKRWSTSAAPQAKDLDRPLLSAAAAAAAAAAADNNNSHLHPQVYFSQTSNPNAKATLFTGNHSIERKRSYNLARQRESSHGANSPSLLFQSGCLLGPSGSLQRSFYDRSLRVSQVAEPLILESGIRNLSLKRKESNVEEPTSAFFATASESARANNNHSKNSENHQLPAMICSQQKQHHTNLEHASDDLVMAALLMERQRQSLAANLESQQQQAAAAALLHQQQQQQQQMIEQQIKWNQQLASLDQHHHLQQQQHNLMAASNASFLQSSNCNKRQQQVEQLTNKSANNNSSSFMLREQQALETQLLKDFLNQMMPKQAQLPEGSNLCTHGGEMLTQSLDSAVPSYRCEACDISFWTADLLEYHALTQCVAREGSLAKTPIAFSFGLQPAASAASSSSSSTTTTTNTNTTGDLLAAAAAAAAASSSLLFASQQQQQQQQYQQLMSKSASPPHRDNLSSAEPPSQRDALLACSARASLINQQRVAQQQQQHLTPSILEGAPSILMQQLTTPSQAGNLQTTAALPHESLPFKKRKISEPNMRY